MTLECFARCVIAFYVTSMALATQEADEAVASGAAASARAAASGAASSNVQRHNNGLFRREAAQAVEESIVRPGAPAADFTGSENISCRDTAGWTNGRGYDCISYAQDLCDDGGPKANMGWTLGPEYNYPEKNCCACGKFENTCVDTPNWFNGDTYKMQCVDYAAKWCTNGAPKEGEQWALGATFNFPEKNCCACGKAPPAVTCTDTSAWDNGHGQGCKGYANMYCERGAARQGMSFALGVAFNHPEANCCVCGKGKHGLTDMRRDHWQPLTKLGKDTSVPIVAIIIGAVLASTAYSSTEKLFGRFVLVIGAQTFVNIFLKSVLSEIELSSTLRGVQVPFLITAWQQVCSFVVLALWSIISQYTPWPYWPKPLNTSSAQAMIAGLSLSFVFNFGLNNLSLCLIDLSLNLIIRACAPLIVYVMEVAICAAASQPLEHNWRPRLYIMGIAATFGFLVVLAKVQANEPMKTHYMGFGCAIGFLSLLASCTEHVLMKYAGPTCNLNTFDMLFHMSLLTTGLLVPAILFVPHPVGWPNTPSMTEAAIFTEVFSLSHVAVALVAVSGVASLGYNAIVYSMVHVLSPEECSLLQNASKVISILFSVALGFEMLPPEPWTPMFVVGVIITFSAFMYASWLPKVKRTEDKRAPDMSLSLSDKN